MKFIYTCIFFGYSKLVSETLVKKIKTIMLLLAEYSILRTSRLACYVLSCYRSMFTSFYPTTP